MEHESLAALGPSRVQFNTVKITRVHDAKLGLLHILLQLAVIGYTVQMIIRDKKVWTSAHERHSCATSTWPQYLRIETPVGSNTLSVYPVSTSTQVRYLAHSWVGCARHVQPLVPRANASAHDYCVEHGAASRYSSAWTFPCLAWVRSTRGLRPCSRLCCSCP